MKYLIPILCLALAPLARANENVHVMNDAGVPVPTIQQGAAHYVNGQVAASTTAATLVPARATRRSVVIKNTDAAITVYVGNATVTAANGYTLKAGESVTMTTNQLVQVIAASGAPVVAYVEVYD